MLRIAALLLLAAPALAAEPVSVPRQRPNILWISCEDISPDLGCYGDPYAHSPNIDAFAKQGVRYTRVHSYAGVCAPSRSSIITGMYPCSIGTHHMRCCGVPPAFVKGFPEYLRAAGYYCTNNSKTDYNIAPPPYAYPQMWDDSSKNAHWRNRPDKKQPFFAVFNILTSHESQIRLPEEQYQSRIKNLPKELLHDPAQANIPPYYPDTPLVRKDWARYHDMISIMDREFAALLKQLDEDGLAGNTIVFFWSDHGRGLPRCKRWLFDGGTHVPMIVRFPDGKKAGTTDDRLVGLMDLGVTALSLAGIKPPEHMQAKAFLGEFAAEPRQYTHHARDRMDETYDIIRAVCDGRYKYIRNFQPQKPYVQYIDYMDQMPTMKEMRRLYKESIAGAEWKPKLPPAARAWFAPEKPEEELYDCQADPHNIRNLAADPGHKETMDRMRAELKRWMDEVKDLAFEKEETLWEKMRPGGVWRVTEPPTLTVRDGVIAGCGTAGASIIYTTEMGKDAHWKLYVPNTVLAPDGKYRFKACRLGYKDSEETVYPK